MKFLISYGIMKISMQIFKNILEKILDKKPAHVGFVGEMILDRFVVGYPERISREAPVIILRYERENLVPGGGANALNNLLSLGLEVNALTIVGNDTTGEILMDIFKSKGVDLGGFIISEGRTTTEKTRFLAGGDVFPPQQLLRLDRITEAEFREDEKKRFKGSLEKLLREEEVIVVSDYGQFMFDEEIIELINSFSHKKILVDSRKSSGKFRGHFFITPNEAEAQEFAEGEGVQLASALKSNTDSRNVVVTLGEKGMAYAGEEGEVYVGRFGCGKAVEVSGAGDTVLAALAYGTLVGLSPLEAVYLASVAAEVVVKKPGTATVTVDEIIDEISKVV